MRRRLASLLILSGAVALFAATPVSGFIINSVDPDPWLSTASGPRTGNGDSATLTWSIVPDGTSLTRQSGFGTSASNLVSFMNSNFGGNPAQSDLTLQPWFHLFDESFARWEALGGVTYLYEPQDDGVLLPSSNGALGMRGDIRIGGYNVDGASGVLAFTYLPPFGSDMVFDTGDAANFTNGDDDFRFFRDVAMHEIGHGFGLLHVESTSQLLMEPFINTNFDGPQLDEVRGVQFFFGDANEKTNAGQGNDTAALATSLGTIAAGTATTIGAAANLPGQAISETAVDFVSIANLDDTDYYSFTVSQPSRLTATLTPRGGVFTQASEGATPTSFDANARNNLALTAFDTNGTSQLATANSNPAGVAESLADVTLPAAGTYFARIDGADDTIQLYEFSLSVAVLLPGDFNFDGVVNSADYVVWRKTDGTPEGYNTWGANFGATDASGLAGASSSSAVPEPRAVVLLFAGAMLLLRRLRHLGMSRH
ncbi:MAG: matrixin family metalloprotease [Planctomycetes bacterium]|nr:matrixin family metalloprotease [Planctomycetota bacterium]